MKCTSCGGRLTGSMTFCPFCGVRQDVDLRQIHFRDLGTDENLPCPHGSIPLDVIEFDSEPAIRIERCTECFGMFFNPGELEALLEAKTNPLVWLDPVQLNRIAGDFSCDHEQLYLKCPMCAERMSHINFAGRSGVILDRCGAHGVWLEGSELRRLLEWWRAGGKHLHQQYEAERVKRMYGPLERAKREKWQGTFEPRIPVSSGSWGKAGDTIDIFSIIGGLLSWLGKGK